MPAPRIEEPPSEEGIRSLFPAKENIKNSSKDEWAIAIRGQKAGGGYVASRATPMEKRAPSLARDDHKERHPVLHPTPDVVTRPPIEASSRPAVGVFTRPAAETPSRPAVETPSCPTAETPSRPTEEIASRRGGERSVLKTAVEFVTQAGVVYRGATEDVSIVGARMTLSQVAHGLQEGMQGTFRFARLADDAGFPCRLVRIKGSEIMLTIHGDTARFGLLVMQEILSHHKVAIS
ncbi:MAG: hypothetical protein HQL64_11800 [Magnetococcales bacterium]|nr:hypothetical protein [Magnetococcales bacterium]